MKDHLDPGTCDLEDAILKVAREVHSRERSAQEMYLDPQGREIPNPTPMQPPIGYKRAPTIQEQMRAMIRQVSHEAAMSGHETEEEAGDFELDEEWEPTSQWEHPFDPDPALEVMLARASKPPAAAVTPVEPPPSSSAKPAEASPAKA